MGCFLNDYGKRMRTMATQNCSSEKHKKQCNWILPSLLDPFERKKRTLSLPSVEFAFHDPPHNVYERNGRPARRTPGGGYHHKTARRMSSHLTLLIDDEDDTRWIIHKASPALATSRITPDKAGVTNPQLHIVHSTRFTDDSCFHNDDPHRIPQIGASNDGTYRLGNVQHTEITPHASAESGYLTEWERAKEELLKFEFKNKMDREEALRERDQKKKLLEELDPSSFPVEADAECKDKALLQITSTKQKPVWKELKDKADEERNSLLQTLGAETTLLASRLAALKLTREKTLFPSRILEDKEKSTSAAFIPLSEEEEAEVQHALYGPNKNEILVKHEGSNIDITRGAMQCLRPGAWLNDEVINLYLELLKEREKREPKNFLNCHFFNTFFFNKLYKDAHAYDYKAVRRWTTQRKLGYSILECDKIFVPIHKDIHWCLAVINIHEKKLQYLDSLKGRDGNVLQILARYIKDEAKDKMSQDLDVDSWDQECLQDIPEQFNGCDCGMFMAKYADFFSRGNRLNFSQGDMEYFRKRTVLELLQLKAR